MARAFGVPFDINQEDKVVGGYLSLRQLGWFGVPFGVLILEFVVDMSWIKDFNIFIFLLKILILIVFLGGTIFMAFGSMDGMNADSYVFKMVKFKRRNKIIKYSDKI